MREFRYTQTHKIGVMWALFWQGWLQSFIQNGHSIRSTCCTDGHSIGNCKDFLVLILLFLGFNLIFSWIELPTLTLFICFGEHPSSQICMFDTCFLFSFRTMMRKLFFVLFCLDWMWSDSSTCAWFGFGSTDFCWTRTAQSLSAQKSLDLSVPYFFEYF